MYDVVLGRLFAASRRRAVALLDLQPGDMVALPGVGTGLDLSLLPVGVSAVGVDLSPEMLARARARLPLPERHVDLVEGDAVAFLHARPASFDAVVLNLVLSVVPDAWLPDRAAGCGPGGRGVVFDKFAPPGRVRIARRVVNLVTSRLGTDVTRPFEAMLRGSGGRVVHDEPTLCGLYRVVLLERVE